MPTFTKRHDPEEALAVAFSHVKLQDEHGRSTTNMGRIPNLYYAAFIDLIYEYKSPGYKDWRNYGSWPLFNQQLMRYVDPPNTDRLLANGIPVQSFLEAQLDRVFECRKIEKIA